MSKWRCLLAALMITVPALGLVGCNGGSDNTDSTTVTNATETVVMGTLKVTVDGAIVPDVFDAVEIRVDGDAIGSVGWPGGGTLNYPTAAGSHKVTAKANAGTRHWNAIPVDVPESASATVILNVGNSSL